ncbi:Transposase [Lactobacillus helveticus CIRM-BIA 103]|nr:Transposase [Lactobacillus helveticus CIRM-BIA 103]
MVQMKKHKIYEAELIQPACPYWLGSRNKNN